MAVEYLKKSPASQLEETTQLEVMPLGSLAQDPFASTRDSRFYFGSPTHELALSQLWALLDDGNQGWGVLCSEAGLGKTLLRTMLHNTLDPRRFVGVSVETSLLSFDELLLEIISQLSGERVYGSEFPDRYSRLSEFKLLLTKHIVNSDRHLALLLDEAHGLERDTLEGLRNLSNIGAEQYNLMTIVLIGNSRLESRLHRLPELDQRIAVRTSLVPLDEQQTRDYVWHRLNVAGCESNVRFAETSWDGLWQVSRGVPRQINRILKCAIAHAHSNSTGLGDDNMREAFVNVQTLQTSKPGEFNSLGISRA